MSDPEFVNVPVGPAIAFALKIATTYETDDDLSREIIREVKQMPREELTRIAVQLASLTNAMLKMVLQAETLEEAWARLLDAGSNYE
jgi:hypothetical protein